jgi:hypothetical protein
MTKGSGGYGWMRIVLALLFDEYSHDDAVRLLRDDEARSVFRREVDRRLAGNGLAEFVPAGDRGDNLLQAIIALRVKFPRQEAAAKLDLNIAMRERRG